MSRIIGIDVGGTNTNAAFIEDGTLIATVKYPTDHHNLISSVSAVLEEINHSIPHHPQEQLELHLSTTLTTNAIVGGRGQPVAAILTPGPGASLADLKFPLPAFPVKGTIDHRGRETEPLDLSEVRQALNGIRQKGITALAIVGKFSTRNPQHELAIAELVRQEYPEFDSITLGHSLSGRLNFPRRVRTAFLNASICHIQTGFAAMIKELSARYGIGEQIFLLKADGGTMLLTESLIRPVETILSGPAASIMSVLALGSPAEQTTVTLDIGGTTTEIGVIAGGQPLEERDGAVIAGYRTLVPALFSRSFGLGGDSRVYWADAKIQIGPERMGPPIARGGQELTPTDAVIALGKAPFGDVHKARLALEGFGREAGMGPEDAAKQIIAVFCEKVATQIEVVFDYLNSRPVYTVSEALAPRVLKPEKIIGMGGPAEFFIPKIAARLGLPYQVLPFADSANAVCAAASRPTVAINLRADTALGKMVIPELNEITDLHHGMLYDLKQVRKTACEKAAAYAGRVGINQEQLKIEITDEEVFNVVRGFYTTGKIFFTKAQVKPGVKPVKLP